MNLDGIEVSLPPEIEDPLAAVWRSLPEPDRRDITTHWTAPSRRILPVPSFEVRESLPGAFGMTMPGGRRIFFVKKAFEKPIRFLACLIAHELAHVHDWAGFGPTRGRLDILRDDDPSLYVPMERYAVRKAWDWKYELPGSGHPLWLYLCNAERAVSRMRGGEPTGVDEEILEFRRRVSELEADRDRLKAQAKQLGITGDTKLEFRDYPLVF